MIMKINLTAIIQAKPEHIETVKSLLKDMVFNSIKEESCLQYDLHQSADDPHIFIFHEVWENETGFEKHNQQPYIEHFRKVSADLMERPVLIYRTERVEVNAH